jgi:hypothetical protein
MSFGFAAVTVGAMAVTTGNQGFGRQHLTPGSEPRTKQTIVWLR